MRFEKKAIFKMVTLQFAKILVIMLTIIPAQALAEFDSTEEARSSLIEKEPKFKDLKIKVIECLGNSWCSKEKASLLMDLVLSEKPDVCVEIGVFTGSSFLPVVASLKYLKHGKAIAVDAWSNAEAVKFLPLGDPNTIWWGQVEMKEVRRSFFQLKKQWSLGSYLEVLDMPSNKAVEQIESIDLINFDGNFSERASLEDVKNYFPKIKVGGYILFSNALVTINGELTKMEAFFRLLDACEVVAEIDGGNAFLLRKTNEFTD